MAMRLGVLTLAILMALSGGASVQAQTDFYRGKNIRIVVGSEAGGGFSTYSLLLSAHLGKHIPGNPSVTIEHRPGAGGVNAIDYLASAAPKDGTVIAVAMPNFYRDAVCRAECREIQSGGISFPRPDERLRSRAGELAHQRREDHGRSESQGDRPRRFVAPLDHVDPAGADQ